ncbi:MAG: helix-turn-helix transcriptional regulator [Levilactobacillus sp.]|jgi:DNA-binding XRE family transcriptional regulator|uniref:helix-turn-helix domain-containing protein n=1 Tax=Levilactobacillus sp. TaxID=2767919 RepID=UPI00258579CA|nr:helix-turn-helix transcriptional regulator [Levilactobacillus sp.]MCI1553255.1 helix-turn-helix transcriptional regulator [Levilactobacillus sp.]MCI1599388.1 helix-turn-helix transcriptional regulator [Levilactobacillus sp.]MCI1606776.1 helix-turn-helix transcriptional regulator [Levilactobacillus sp.]
MKTGYVDSIIEKRMKDESTKADMLNEKAKLDLAVSLMKAREHAKLTQKQLAELAGTSQNAISRVENGNGNLSLKTLTRIADALDQPLAIRFGN